MTCSAGSSSDKHQAPSATHRRVDGFGTHMRLFLVDSPGLRCALKDVHRKETRFQEINQILFQAAPQIPIHTVTTRRCVTGGGGGSSGNIVLSRKKEEDRRHLYLCCQTLTQPPQQLTRQQHRLANCVIATIPPGSS